MTRALQKPPQEVAAVIDAAYGPEPEQVLRIYVPAIGVRAVPGCRPLPRGRLRDGEPRLIDEPSRALANDVEAIVVATTYRKAPESKFPAAHDDALTALRWVAAHVGEYGGDPSRLAVMGDSAGGNLAASAAIRARDEGGPALRAMALLYPMVSPDRGHPSRREFAAGVPHRRAQQSSTADSQYTANAAGPLDPRLALDRTPSLAGLPPTLVLTNEYDMTRDEGEAFARRLAEEGVEVTAQRFDGLVHIVYWMSGAVPKQAEMHAAVVEFLRKHLT